MIQFARGDVASRRIMQALNKLPRGMAMEELNKVGLKAYPTTNAIKTLIPPRGDPGASSLARIIKRWRNLKRSPFSPESRLASILDGLIQFKDNSNWVDNPLYPENTKTTVQDVPIKHIVSHQNTVDENIVDKYKKKPARGLPTLHKIAPRFYVVEDGNHRIVAKKDKGHKNVKAKVVETLSILDNLIQFKELYQPKKKDEPPGELPVFREGELIDYNVQRHNARRAGLHRDVRIGNRKHGLLSWATRSKAPGHGETVPIHQQPTHPHSYLGWGGEISSGYGAGTVKSEDLGKALVTKSTPGELHATLADRKGSHRLAFIKTKSGWLLSQGRSPHPPKGALKPPAKSIQPGEAKQYLANLNDGSSVQPKIDGALVYVSTKGGRPEIFSHRVSKTTGSHPVHTERVFRGRPTYVIPKEHQHTLVAELYGKVRGKAIPPQELGGLLNAHIGESIRKQKEKGIRLKVMPFDVVGGSGDYASRLGKVKATLSHLPQDVFHPPEEAKHPSAALRLYNKVRSGQHSLTKEGLIIHPPRGKMVKIKNVEEENVKIHSLFPGTGKFEGSHGGFYYADKSGKPLGKVGTGFTDETRRNLHKYIGRTARVRYQEKYPSGRLRAPSFIAVEENK